MYMPCVKCVCSELKLANICILSSFDIKLKKSRSGFDLVTVLISKQSFFQHHVWPVKDLPRSIISTWNSIARFLHC